MLRGMETRSGRIPQPKELESLRSRIDQVDEGLVDLMATRQRLAIEAHSLKNAHGIALEDLAREAAVVRRASDLARKQGLDPEVTRDVFWRLIGLSRTIRPPGGQGDTSRAGEVEGLPSQGDRE
jgi:chorismate mutase